MGYLTPIKLTARLAESRERWDIFRGVPKFLQEWTGRGSTDMAITIINKGNAESPKNPNPNELWIDHETGMIHRPNNEPIALNGPTSGSEYEQLKAKEKQAREMMLRIKRELLSVHVCPQCGWKGRGDGTRANCNIGACRIKRATLHGVEMELLVCPDTRCDSPVLRVEDAMDLRSMPGGKA
jgi:hypothetical protein